MNLLDAIISGKKFKRPSWTCWVDQIQFILEDGSRVTIPDESELALDDFETTPPDKIEITKEDLEKAWDAMVSKENSPFHTSERSFHFEILAKQLGLI